MLNETKKEASEWKKFNIRGARYAHISKERIFVGMEARVKGARVEYSVSFPNEGLIRISKTGKREAKSYYICSSVVGFLKDIFAIQHYPENTGSGGKELGVNVDTVYLQTKKGEIKGDAMTLGGQPINSPDVQAVY